MREKKVSHTAGEVPAVNGTLAGAKEMISPCFFRLIVSWISKSGLTSDILCLAIRLRYSESRQNSYLLCPSISCSELSLSSRNVGRVVFLVSRYLLAGYK